MKKILALLLCLILVLSLAACGTTTTPDVLVGDSTTEEIPETPQETPEVWDGDYENATFDDVRKYGLGSTNWDGSLPLTTTGEKLEIGLRVSSQVSDYETNPFTLWLEEQTGVDLSIRKFVGAATDYSTQISLMLAGGEDVPDLIYVGHEGNDRRSEYLEVGYFYNLAGYYITDSYYLSEALNLSCKDDPVKYAMMLNNINQNAANQRTGQVYGIVNVMDNPTDVVHVEAHINTEWLQKLGLQKPTTIDELYDVLVAFRDKDPNGNGKKDEIPMMGLHHSLGRGVENLIINAFIQYAPARKVMIEDGKAFSYHNQDEYRQALIFMNKLIKEGLLSELAFTSGPSELQRLLNPVGDEPYTVGICCAYTTGDFHENSESIFKYEPLAALKDYTGRGGYSMFDAPTVLSYYAIAWDCVNPLLAFRFMDFMHSPVAYMHQRWGVEGVDWDWIENTPYKDQAKGNGMFGGDAKYVIYNDGFREDAHWFSYCYYADEMNWQVFVDPNKNDYVNTYYKKSAQNVLLQREVGQPEDELLIFTRTAEEDELFFEYNSELSTLLNAAKTEFCMGRRDPNSDADWQAYLDELKALKFERWAEIGQASFDRQKAETEALLATLEK